MDSYYIFNLDFVNLSEDERRNKEKYNHVKSFC